MLFFIDTPADFDASESNETESSQQTSEPATAEVLQEGGPDTANVIPYNMRKRILIEAKELFRKKGYASVSINDIVKTVGITKPTLYYYYGDKENLFTQVVIEVLEQGKHHVEMALGRIEGQEMSLRDKLFHLTHGFLQHSPASLSAMFRDAMEQLSEAPLNAIREAYENTIVVIFESFFAQTMATHEVSSRFSPKDLAILYVGLIDTYTVYQLTITGKQFDKRRHSELIVDVLLNGIGDTANRSE